MLRVDEAPNIPSRQLSEGGSRRRQRTVDVAAIESLNREDCLERWRKLFGAAPPKYTSLEFMRKALAYEAQVKAFGGHSNAVQRALKASLKTAQLEIVVEESADRNIDNLAPVVSASCVELQGVVVRTALSAHQILRHDTSGSDACDQISIKGRGQIEPSVIARIDGKANSNTDAYTSTKSSRVFKPPIPTKPSVLSIRAGTHLVREWNGRTYQVEALEKGFRLDGKTYRSLSAIAKKITGAHWSGPRFFGLES